MLLSLVPASSSQLCQGGNSPLSLIEGTEGGLFWTEAATGVSLRPVLGKESDYWRGDAQRVSNPVTGQGCWRGLSNVTRLTGDNAFSFPTASVINVLMRHHKSC